MRRGSGAPIDGPGPQQPGASSGGPARTPLRTQSRCVWEAIFFMCPLTLGLPASTGKNTERMPSAPGTARGGRERGWLDREWVGSRGKGGDGGGPAAMFFTQKKDSQRLCCLDGQLQLAGHRGVAVQAWGRAAARPTHNPSVHHCLDSRDDSTHDSPFQMMGRMMQEAE
jgi:hypothetical protein